MYICRTHIHPLIASTLSFGVYDLSAHQNLQRFDPISIPNSTSSHTYTMRKTYISPRTIHQSHHTSAHVHSPQNYFHPIHAVQKRFSAPTCDTYFDDVSPTDTALHSQQPHLMLIYIYVCILLPIEGWRSSMLCQCDRCGFTEHCIDAIHIHLITFGSPCHHISLTHVHTCSFCDGRMHVHVYESSITTCNVSQQRYTGSPTLRFRHD